MSKTNKQSPKPENYDKPTSLEQAKEMDSLNLETNLPKGVKRPKMTMK